MSSSFLTATSGSSSSSSSTLLLLKGYGSADSKFSDDVNKAEEGTGGGAAPTGDMRQQDPAPPSLISAGVRSRFGLLHSHGSVVGEGFTPLYRTFSDGFSPMYRTVSEGVRTLARPSFKLSQRALDPNQDRLLSINKQRGTSSIPSEVVNLAKNTIGGGVMSLSGGIALYATDVRGTVILALVLILGLGFLYGYFCLVTAKSCEYSRSGTYRECWERTKGGGNPSSRPGLGGLLVAIATTMDPLMNIFVNSAILSQSLQYALEGLFDVHWSIPTCLIVIAVVALLPLCLMRTLDALAPFSAFGVSAVLVALTCMTIRCIDGSYLPGGAFHDHIIPKYRPNFAALDNHSDGNESNRSFLWSFLYLMPFLTMASTAFDMHYNSPRYYAELKDASIPRFTQVCVCSFSVISALYASIALVGFLTFGSNCDSFILNNYAADDKLATVARLSMGFSSMLTYPLNFMGMRDNLLDLLGLADEFKSPAKMRFVVVLMLGVCITVACFVTDLGLISSIGGGTTVTLVAFVFPALMFREVVRQRGKCSFGEKVEVGLVTISMVAMVFFGLLGVICSLTLS